MTRVGRVIALLAVASLVGACARTDAPGTPSVAPATGTTDTDRAGRDSTKNPYRPPGAAPADQSRTPRPPTASSVPATANDQGNPGANAPAYLRGSVPRLVVEIDAVEDKAPGTETIALIRTRLSQVADKPGGIEIRAIETIAARGGGAWSFEALRAAEARYRDTHTTADRASLYLLFVDGSPPKPGAIGVSYSASAAAMFVDQIADASTLLVTAAAIERAATVHEVGHLLSLVNFGYTSPRDHEDPEHPGHSSNDGSVMYWAVDNVGVVSILGGRTEPPTEFDRDDQADLADIRAGKLP